MFDSLLIQLVAFQTIIVNSTQPCFLNQTAGPNMFQNCGMGKDFLTGILTGWQWVTGGWFSMILVSILVAFVYIKYHKAIYTMVVGTLYLPLAYFLFPSMFLTFGLIMATIGAGILIYYAIISQTNEA